MQPRAVVAGVGHYLPKKVVPNCEFEKTLDTTDEWIRTRSGIERRHFADDTETTSFMATTAARSALAMAGVSADDVDAIIVATSTADLTFPSAATMVQSALGMTRGFAFDVQAVCAGFVFALSNANALIVSGQAHRVLVIGAETFSRIMDWTDRGTCVLFGDGAGAVVIERSADAPTLLGWDLMSDGSAAGILSCEHGGKIFMNGKEVFRRAVLAVEKAGRNALERAGVNIDDIALVVPHQANIRIIDAALKRLDIPLEKAAMVLERTGNTSAASIPLALVDALDNDRVAPGDLVLMVGFGAGMSSAAAVIRWDPPGA